MNLGSLGLDFSFASKFKSESGQAALGILLALRQFPALTPALYFFVEFAAA
jgi:hypothetical protein